MTHCCICCKSLQAVIWCVSHPRMVHVGKMQATHWSLFCCQWTQNTTHWSADRHVNPRRDITWWCGWCVVCGVLAGLTDRLFFCGHKFTPTCYTHSHVTHFYSLFSKCCCCHQAESPVVRQIKTCATFTGETHWKMNCTATILALNAWDLRDTI